MTTLASRHRFREVLRSYSVFDRQRRVLTCPTGSAAFGVSTPLTFVALAIHAPIARSKRSWSSPFEAFPSHLIPTRCRVQDESRIAEQPNGRFATLARIPLPIVEPANKIVALHFQLSFWALLPLRIRQSPAVLRPRTIRCSPGFCLSKDFPLPAPNPPSRAFRSRTCATVDLATGCRAAPQRFSLRGGQLSLARLSISIEPMRSGCCPF